MTTTTDESEDPQLAACDIGPRRMRESLAVLSLLHDFPALQRFAERWGQFHRYLTMIDFFVGDCIRSVKLDLVDDGSLTSETAMRAAAERLFRNTCKRISISKAVRMVDFIKFFTGASLRWEALAVFFLACGLCCSSLRSRDDPIFDSFGHRQQDKQALMERILQASRACVSYCEDAGELSDLGMWVLHENTIFISQVLGDNHYLVWRQCHDASAHIIERGLHMENRSVLRQQPFWLIEMRRRALACAFSTDKLLCTFVGRPPRLSQRYCLIHVPLDLELSELCLEGTKLQEALSNIDEDGWNRKYSKKAAYLRCFVLSSRLREEVLELSLGPPQDHLLEKAMDIIRRNRELLSSFPERIRYNTDMWNHADPARAFMAAQAYLDVLYNEFMLRRTLYRRLGESRSELLKLSHRILSVILQVSNIRGCHTSNADYIPWIMVLYGLPTAGVLSLELLQGRQVRSPSLPGEFSWTQVIPDLCVFISNLKWMHVPGDGNYKLSEQAHKSLQQILDKVLSDYIVSPVQHDPILTSPHQPTRGLEDPADGFSWYESTEFDIDFWINLPDNLQLS
ncbi:uncharacterized protein Z518_02017 [Rhinocladiella mackenziei CBS 650.93]|uniref:Xylanolytic transcriptional activator regulatory domain-containing protein n=1 Tax=Rhinocladiella mackenziei CBS 650.93 TaxID=1442369 RepID=A0A0D2ING3_9EURO|nr:uncharacterized protein Z518_02017 [Rhinocladiella mackenziei CBS 650.93]KIX07364.1 hypothetical protein Z518_02017 [Rhinocladiella mackenziei CBS 650.93]